MSVILSNKITLSNQITLGTGFGFVPLDIPVNEFEVIQTSGMNPSAGSTFTIQWSADGFNLIYANSANNRIYNRTHTIAFDISSGIGVADQSNITSNWSGIVFNDDGLQITTIDSSDFFREYTLSSPYDVTTMVSTGNSKFIGSGFHSQPFFSSDGTRLWNNSGTSIKEWTLGVGFDLSTISASPVKTLDLTQFFSNFGAWHFSARGTKIYLIEGSGSRLLASLDLSTPFDILAAGSPATASYDNSGLSMTAFGIPRGMTIIPSNGHLVGVQDQNSRLVFELGKP